MTVQELYDAVAQYVAIRPLACRLQDCYNPFEASVTFHVGSPSAQIDLHHLLIGRGAQHDRIVRPSFSINYASTTADALRQLMDADSVAGGIDWHSRAQ